MEDMSNEKTSAEIVWEYASLLWHWAWFLILLTLIAGGTAYFVAQRGTPIYQTSTLIMVNGAPGTQTDSYSSLYLAQQLTSTYAQTMTTKPMLDAVAQELGLEALPVSIQVQPVEVTSLMRITVQGPDPNQAALIANTLFRVFAEQVQADQSARYAGSKRSLEEQMASISQKIEDATVALTTLQQQIQDTQNELDLINKQIADTTRYYGLNAVSDEDRSKQAELQSTLLQYQIQLAPLQTTVSQHQNTYYYMMQNYENVNLTEAQSTSLIIQKDPAVPQPFPIQPQPVRSALLAAVIGLMIGGGIVFLREYLDDTLRDPSEITRKWGIPVLGTILNYNANNGDALITQKQPRSPVTEAFRSLRTNLQFASFDAPIKTLLIASASPRDGKSTVAVNLASVIAQSGFRCVVMDADMRRPNIHRLLQLPNRMGLSDEFILPQNALTSTVQPTKINNLFALTSGSLPPNPSELVGSDKMLEIISFLKEKYDLVLLDTPPSLVVTDANVLATRVDGVLLVIRPSVTKRAMIKHVLEQLRQVKANIIGVVLNDVSIRRSHYYYRGYYGKNSKDYVDDESDDDASPMPAQEGSKNRKTGKLDGLGKKGK